jgi:hypothetical protein
MSAELEQFLAPFSPEVRDLAWRVRDVIRRCCPTRSSSSTSRQS